MTANFLEDLARLMTFEPADDILTIARRYCLRTLGSIPSIHMHEMTTDYVAIDPTVLTIELGDGRAVALHYGGESYQFEQDN
jgi:hypothetical protein